MSLIKLYFEFFKIGLFSVGGGLATLPFLQDLVDKYQWLTADELINMIAISESTPGAIGINTATFVGFEAHGVIGAIFTTLGIVSPSLIIIIFIAHYFKRFHEKKIVKNAFYGIRPAVSGLIASVGFSVLQIAVFNLDKYNNSKNILDLINFKESLLFILVFYLINKYKKHPVIYIFGAAIVGVIFKL